MIVFIRSSLIQRDVRALKYINFLKRDQIKLVQWDRLNESSLSDPSTITFRLSAGYGDRLKSLGKFFKWNIFLFITLFKMRKEIKVIQVCDLDSFFPAVLFRIIGKKVIFDVYDFFADSKISNSRTNIYSILYNLEMFCLRYVDLLILPLDVRKKHLNFIPENLFICENVPHINSITSSKFQFDETKLNIVYAGTLEEKNRGLEWLPELAEKLENKIHIYIAGSGGLEQYFKNVTKHSKNISFLGPLTHSESLSIQKKADLIYGIYRSYLMNNVMAAPNKFYESTYVGTPIVINKGLYISETIQVNNIGFVVEESQEAIFELLQGLDKSKIQEVSKRTAAYWDDNYCDYVHRKYEKEYLDHLARFTNQ